VAALAAETEGASGRDLEAICEQAERTWASKVRILVCRKNREVFFDKPNINYEGNVQLIWQV
jgi:hypothetical protein